MKEKKSTTDVTNSICDQVTQKLVAMMEKGINPWRKPWIQCTEQVAISHTNGKPYSLLNQILLSFRAGEYLTFNQVKKEGGSVKKGAKSELIVFWQCGRLKKVKSPDEEDDDSESESIWVSWQAPILKYYRVFHIDDCEGIKTKYANADDKIDNAIANPIETAESAAEDYCRRSGVKLIVQKSNRAYYAPLLDSVTVPLREQFDEISEFYSTLFHELTHSTGHQNRLKRFQIGEYESKQDYSREELVAEIGAAAALSYLGIQCQQSEENSAAYLKAWATYLKSDPKAFIVAAGKAEKAFNMIFNIQNN